MKHDYEKQLVRGQVIRYKKNGFDVTANITHDYYHPSKRNVHIYILTVLYSDYYGNGFVVRESARLLNHTAEIIKDVPPKKYKELVNDKLVRKMVATKFKKPPHENRVRR